MHTRQRNEERVRKIATAYNVSFNNYKSVLILSIQLCPDLHKVDDDTLHHRFQALATNILHRQAAKSKWAKKIKVRR